MFKEKETTKSKYITRLKRSEGQLRGIQKMMEEDRDCVDIITQLTAVRSSVDRIIELMITENLTTCINQPLDDPEAQKARLEKAVKYLIKRK
ncbi:metal-sensitive transcriptional regulator [Streptococcus sp. Z554]